MAASDKDDLKSAIKLALEAADAAHDSASDNATLRSEARTAFDALTQSVKTLRPVLIGAAAGAAISVALGGLSYMRALAELRESSAMNLEALALLTTRIESLDGQVQTLQNFEANFALAEEVQTARHVELTGRMDAVEGRLSTQLVQEGEALRALITSETAAIQSGQSEALIAGLSDIQLALSRMLAGELSAPPPGQSQSAPAATAVPANAPTPTPAPQANPRPAARPNPFSLP